MTLEGSPTTAQVVQAPDSAGAPFPVAAALRHGANCPAMAPLFLRGTNWPIYGLVSARGGSLRQHPLSAWQLQQQQQGGLPLPLPRGLWRSQLWTRAAQPPRLRLDRVRGPQAAAACPRHPGARHHPAPLSGHRDPAHLAAQNRAESCRNEMGSSGGENVWLPAWGASAVKIIPVVLILAVKTEDLSVAPLTKPGVYPSSRGHLCVGDLFWLHEGDFSVMTVLWA